MNSVVIRHAAEQDIEALLALYVEFHEFHARRLPAWLRIPETYDHTESRETLRGLIQRDNVVILVAEISGVLVGLAEVYLKEDEPHPLVVPCTFGYVQSLVVKEAYRNRGVGRALLETAERWAMGHGGTKLRLSVWEFAESPLPFYEAVGYSTFKRSLVKHL